MHCQCKGKYLARMDADDISHPKRFEEEISFLKDHPEYMWCGTNCKLVDDRGIWGEGVRPEEPGTDDYLKYSPYIHPTVMYRASLFKKVAGYDEGKRLRDARIMNCLCVCSDWATKVITSRSACLITG